MKNRGVQLYRIHSGSYHTLTTGIIESSKGNAQALQVSDRKERTGGIVISKELSNSREKIEENL